MNRNLPGRTAIVLGGSNGAGKACAELFHRAGANLVIGDIDEKRGRATAEELGKGVALFPCDVRNIDQIWALVEHSETTFGPPQAAVYATGVIKPADFLDLTPDDYDLVVDVNLRGAVFFFQSVARTLVARGLPGSLVSISSIGGYVATERTHAYGASKAGLVHLAKSLAVSFAAHGIRANSVAPGGIDTAMQAMLPPRDRRASLARTPMLRLARPDEIAKVALFLASDASSYVTGHKIVADGGRLAQHRTVEVPDDT